ncbi:MAG: hypothetical protein A3A80_04230 [Candidatus Terrybacteria bacterium RIFCSPLOWO2_01_FULL_44_24]|uniref:Zinc-ribbon domain-containing protein n=1 Tax=Candidatus Terrybacteria bacterium RIFCSPHIGHO2_01_FULL_43_35 TaxID=1802361 RepID=A0A1G2PFQ3_9BACT|nr:MAG: hypothetical protein A2828_01105 [Candidatus Terrybacteria bacterium RIFCSPHIGHO2_01_FULL_43_35]OHA51843.1 MAG: hypothetical protein A3A80_04230 [Candidatus Terrybacteria bacterium RIFCSPLOWO2_01_FULL_44_24]
MFFISIKSAYYRWLSASQRFFLYTVNMDNTHGTICPSCHAAASALANFCSQCGKKLKERQLSTSVAKQIIIYLVSFFLAPLGLGYAFKYIKQRDPKTRMIGIVSLALTVIAIVLMIWLTKTFTNSLYGSFNTVGF